MKGNIVTGQILEPYAQALLSIAQSNDAVDQIGQDINSLAATLKSSADLREFLANPIIKAEPKKTVLQQIMGDDLHPYTRNFVMLLVDRGRIGFLEGICKQYQGLVRKLNQTVLAEVTSVTELTEEQLATLKHRVKAMTNAREVELETRLDPDLIGGVVIQIGSQVIDASLRGQLRRLSLRLGSTV